MDILVNVGHDQFLEMNLKKGSMNLFDAKEIKEIEKEKVFSALTMGGGVFVHVKNGRIVKIRPMTFQEDEVKPWSIKVGDRVFTPQKKTKPTRLSGYLTRLGL